MIAKRKSKNVFATCTSKPSTTQPSLFLFCFFLASFFYTFEAVPNEYTNVINSCHPILYCTANAHCPHFHFLIAHCGLCALL